MVSIVNANAKMNANVTTPLGSGIHKSISSYVPMCGSHVLLKTCSYIPICTKYNFLHFGTPQNPKMFNIVLCVTPM